MGLHDLWSPFFPCEDKVKKRIVIAMSGGVDSSVAAAILKEQGHEVIGVTMELWDGSCHGAEPQNAPPLQKNKDVVAEARKVAAQLNIPFHSFDLKTDFQHQVVDPFCDAYLSGLTPNPCIICNKFLKFGSLLQITKDLGAEYLATGHYVDLARNDGFFQVRKGIDRNKDQSYFLFSLDQKQLSKCLFPLGKMNKVQVRGYAAQLNLSVAEKAESQDICFIPDGDYTSFLQRERGLSLLSGDIIHISGQVLGQHQGTYKYTIGQRKGLGIAWSEPLYVVAINAPDKQVVVGEKQHLSRVELLLSYCNWSIPQPQEEFTVACRIRYRHIEVPAKVAPLSDNRAKVFFETAQKGITPGQAAVFYADDLVIGGGWIQ
ncbi:MAG: tRNA 2-thiouridine(34) synthase MnmA [Deltaproteobacteria bacterium]|nr:tRNA 2-thiouridine(34) synthase MnmA [Deltaproteobacteria bacterium]MCW8892372.1 tRNA 2-thiouridine(34) synthase MnmA [Deltaproteobacteria bacterium]